MKVKDLITELKKMPKELDVYMADHDHGEYETSSKTNRVYLVNQSNADEREKDGEYFYSHPKKYIVIRA